MTGIPRGIRAFLVNCAQSWKWGKRSEVEELGFLHDTTSPRWQLDSHDVLLCSHEEEPPPATEKCLSPAAPLKGPPAWQLQDTVLKTSNRAICSERKITYSNHGPSVFSPLSLSWRLTGKMMKIVWPPRGSMLECQVKESPSN